MQDSIGDVTLLLHAGLLRHQPQIKLEKVDEIVDELGYEKIADILGEAMAASPPLRKRTLTKGGILAEALAADARRVKAQKEESLRIEDLRKKLVEEETLRAEILEELQSQT
ncbi:MAG: hypothetical protein DDT37_01789 [Firmicutes bacterium]|nr:hypothetical protein [candidate division NPL-UPA2 bacterium]